ncbi:LOW QUALITY PROTEIN: cysteine proteinase 5-like [Solanum pennellii]|uniref:LOW QUALITY PROTEIN: cysteine proteinase 5-like n=1 Tax=Solanum pennellii TaxID=28526 RepID=A0ABM1V6R8_SOLPN|nr:LOW QUALITY PROTEIN: cysteine proteinase 5-like [Solanum pennellii]
MYYANYKRLKNHFTSMSLFLTQTDISLIVLMARTLPTERTPEEEVHITRPSWSKPEVKRLGKDDFFKENIKFRWVGRNCLLGIDNQGHCCTYLSVSFLYSITSFKYELIITNSSSSSEGCCWAFTSTEAITAAYALKNKREIVSLSKQQLIDCMYTKYKKPSYFANLGEKECFPCSYNKAYKFAMDYGITVETKYPFMEERGKCECHTELVSTSSSNLSVVIRTYSRYLSFIIFM